MSEEIRAKYDVIYQIIKRAQRMGITIGEQITQFLDVENADKQFSMRLQEWLDADDFDFAHDFIGIQANMDREVCKVRNFFVPRFAANQ